jgi:ferric-dicitrate binding protein FerR (iron transport regulator)
MNTQMYEEASDWLVKHRTSELDHADKVAFDLWLRTSPQHVRAYLEMAEIWEDASSLDSAGSAGVDELIARARGEDNVVSLGGAGVSAGAGGVSRGGDGGVGVSRGDGDGVRGGGGDDVLSGQHAGSVAPDVERGAVRKFPRRALLAASIVVACAGGGVFAWLNRPPVYSTGIGEQRSLTLADGSTVTLDTRTRIRVRFSAGERNIDLLDGRALFRVAKNDRKPFVVQSDRAAARAVGTEFDIYRRAAGVTVTVLEGRVAVTSGQRRADAVVVPAGEQVAVVGSAGVTPPAVADVAAATAWTRRRLIFESAPLSAVVEEFNRYNTRRLVIRDPRLSGLHVSGVFASTDPALLVQFLQMQAEISVRERDDEIDIDER